MHDDHTKVPKSISLARSDIHRYEQLPGPCDIERCDVEAEGSECYAAWKHVGYPGFSRWLSSPEHFTIRKFGDLNVRVLLKLQNRIVIFERKLQSMDDFTRKMPNGGCGSLEADRDTPRENLLEQIGEALKDYNERLNTFLQIHSRPAPSQFNNQQTQEWLDNRPDVIDRPELEFLVHSRDLVAANTPAVPRSQSWLTRAASPLSTAFPLCNPATDCLASHVWTASTSKSVLSIVPLTMLLGPAWAMAFTHVYAEKLIIVSAFTALFSVLLTLNTSPRRTDLCLAVAGYFAIMMLIIGVTPAWSPQRISIACMDDSATSSVVIDSGSRDVDIYQAMFAMNSSVWHGRCSELGVAYL